MIQAVKRRHPMTALAETDYVLDKGAMLDVAEWGS